MSAPSSRRAPLIGVPRPGLFAALTCLTAVSSPAIYYGVGAAGLSYLVALVAVPAIAALGAVRSGRRGPRPEGRRWSGRHRLSWVLALASVPAALALDVGLRLGLDEDVTLGILLVIYVALLALGLLALTALRRLTSTRATLAALGITAASLGTLLLPASGYAGLVLVTAPLLLLASAVYPPAPTQEGQVPLSARGTREG